MIAKRKDYLTIVQADGFPMSGGKDDYKTTLQEIVQKNGRGAVSYTTISETGKEHNKQFTVQVIINGEPRNTGTGHSKKEAEQAAAKAAVTELKNAKKV